MISMTTFTVYLLLVKACRAPSVDSLQIFYVPISPIVKKLFLSSNEHCLIKCSASCRARTDNENQGECNAVIITKILVKSIKNVSGGAVNSGQPVMRPKNYLNMHLMMLDSLKKICS
jgi:hypothetical protein